MLILSSVTLLLIHLFSAKTLARANLHSATFWIWRFQRNMRQFQVKNWAKYINLSYWIQSVKTAQKMDKILFKIRRSQRNMEHLKIFYARKEQH